MPYNRDLEESIDDIVHPWDGLEKKKMFGGIGYLVHGNMCFGIWKDYLIVRMSPELAAEKLNNVQAMEFDITGRPMRGWVMVGKGSWIDHDELARWLEIGKSFALSLPKKLQKRKSLEEIYYRTKKQHHGGD